MFSVIYKYLKKLPNINLPNTILVAIYTKLKPLFSIWQEKDVAKAIQQ